MPAGKSKTPTTPTFPAETPLPAPKKDSAKIVLIILVMLLSGAFFVLVGYLIGTKTSSEIVPLSSSLVSPTRIQTTPISEPTAGSKATDTSNWNTYVNQKFSYSLKYPPLLILEALSEGDNIFTEDVVEVGDEGTFISAKNADADGMRKTMTVAGEYLTAANNNKTLRDIVSEGTVINPCHEEKPQKIEEVTSQSGAKGLKVWYWVKEGCQGARERGLNDPYVFFDLRPKQNALVEFFEAQMDEYFDVIVSTFSILAPVQYGD